MSFKNSLESYPNALKKFRQRHNEYDLLRPILNEVAINENFAENCEIALSLGTGYGQYDIEFFQYCTKLKKLIIVEKNHDCVEALVPNLKNHFGDKVEFEIYEMSIDEFMKGEVSAKLQNKLDVVASFHSIYCLNARDRRNFLQLCFDSWLKLNKGKLLVLNASRDCVFVECFKELAAKVNPFQDTTTLREELNDISCTIDREIFYPVKIDLKEYGNDLYYMAQYSHKEVVNHEEMERALRKVSHDGYGFMNCELIVTSRKSSA